MADDVGGFGVGSDGVRAWEQVECVGRLLLARDLHRSVGRDKFSRVTSWQKIALDVHFVVWPQRHPRLLQHLLDKYGVRT
jgi:hypothetical protein